MTEYMVCDSCSHEAGETVRHAPPVPCNRSTTDHRRAFFKEGLAAMRAKKHGPEALVCADPECCPPAVAPYTREMEALRILGEYLDEVSQLPDGVEAIDSKDRLTLGLLRALRTAARAGVEDREPCSWTPDEDGIYTTGCGKHWCFIDGTPDENDAHFCPYCGGALLDTSATTQNRASASEAK